MARGGSGPQITIQIAPARYLLCATGPLDQLTADDINTIVGQGQEVDFAEGQITVAPVGSDATADIQVINRTTGAVVDTLGTATFPDGSLKMTDLPFTVRTIDEATEALTLGNITGGSGTAGSSMSIIVKKAN